MGNVNMNNNKLLKKRASARMKDKAAIIACIYASHKLKVEPCRTELKVHQ